MKPEDAKVIRRVRVHRAWEAFRSRTEAMQPKERRRRKNEELFKNHTNLFVLTTRRTQLLDAVICSRTAVISTPQNKSSIATTLNLRFSVVAHLFLTA